MDRRKISPRPLPEQIKRTIAQAPSSSYASRSSGNESQKFIAIGIDFGTTYSGASWAFSGEPEEIHEVKNWPCQYHESKDECQVPTQYDIATGAWGYEVTTEMTPMKWFKLLLLRDGDIKPEIRDSQQLKAARALLAQSKDLTPVKLIGLYLAKLWEHVLADIKTVMDFDALPFKVSITIPAIWPPYAHRDMRDAAKLALILKDRDIGDTTLDLVQEPEAAGLATLFHRERNQYPEIEVGESFVVCDAGGGTIDIITYEVQSTMPFKIKESVTGDGKLSGAFLVDEAFEQHMKTRKKLKLSSLPEAEYNMFVRREWEYGSKRVFTGEDNPPQFFLRTPSKAFGKMAILRGKDQFALTRDEMIHFFTKSLTGIRTLVQDQRNRVKEATGRFPKKILLVGGLGSSPYIYNMLQKQFSQTVLKPGRPWSAVARGAVIRLLTDKLSVTKDPTPQQKLALRNLPEVTARKSRYSYGILAANLVSSLSDFDPDLDVVSKDPYGKDRTDRMDWFLRIGEEVSNKLPVKIPYVQWSQTPKTKEVFVIRLSEERPPPARKTYSVKESYRIECEYDKPFSQWTPVAGAADGWREYDDMAVTMLFDGEPKWRIRMGENNEEHDAKVSYMS